MARIGVLLDTENGEAKESNFGVITVARKNIDNEIYGLFMGKTTASCKAAVQEYGVKRIIEITAGIEDLSVYPELQVKALVEAIQYYKISALIGVSSTVGRDLMARIAATLNVPLVLDCVSVDLENKIITKSHFSGKTIAKIKLNSEMFICGIRPNTIESSQAPTEAEIETFSSSIHETGSIKIVKTKGASSSRINLTEANIVISGGRPIASADNFSILEECAQVLGAAVGASRAAVDAGYAPESMQVGQTGKTVSPKLYIGCGLSGSVQHYAGMKTSNIIVAINTDKEAPIFSKCDYGILGDLFEVVPALTEELKKPSIDKCVSKNSSRNRRLGRKA